MTDADTVTITLESANGTDELTLPSAILDMLREDTESDAAIVGDVAMFGVAQRVHGAVHHGQGEVDEELEAVERATLDLFEERFGASFGELTGHDH